MTKDYTMRSRSAEGGSSRHGSDEANSLMREYFVQKALEKKAKREKEEEEEKIMKEELARKEKERKKLMKMEERFRLEEERDSRLLRIIRGEMKKDQEDYAVKDKRGKGKARLNERGETVEEEKERLRRMLRVQYSKEDDTENEELRMLRRRAAKLEIHEKRKRGPDVAIGNSPPMVTPEKRTGPRLTEESKKKIEELKSASKPPAESSETPTKLDLSLKHITTSCGPGGKEKFEQKCRDFYDALTIEELKEVYRRERVPYGKRELAIKRLVIRRSVVAYDPTVLPLPTSPRQSSRKSVGIGCSKEEVKESMSEDSDSEDEEDSE
ncbi:hypothetical protein CBR_g38154 [Chara braunii]|uniref:Uncharacterized protein n=1 Tax=Chara braunii TaxID=69332 RepID=A0A388LPH8_CHABU|nr:hypothetical protein CBR_g38154 [Chara braunii]|eukprot:GBG84181.1 hypothetical protein CBR_g38154 [Chara braunii]